MKTSLSLALLPAMMLALSTFTPSLSAAPTKGRAAATESKPAAALKATISINPAELAPDSTIEVVFPTPMVAKEKIGKVDNEAPVIVVPELQGTFEWTSTRSGHFRLAQSPKFASSYAFKLRSGLTDLAGKPLSTETIDSVTSARFQITDQYPK
jgi:hypothetical protein